MAQTILKRAESMADECHDRARVGRDVILRDASERLHLREEKETLLAKAMADRTYRRKVQADELKLHSRMDHLRWNLVQAVIERLPFRMTELTQDKNRYFTLLQAYLSRGAEMIEADTLVVELNANDQRRLQNNWDEFAGAAVPDKQLLLAEEPIRTIGGLCLRTQDNRIRLDQTFEGRLERLEDRLYQAIVERLLPPPRSGASL
nr:V-type ATP synthase subunit E family protein [endosymbiont of Lamellibrachia barhami]